MSEVKPPTSASLPLALEVYRRLSCEATGPHRIEIIRSALDSSRRAALGQAAEIVQTYLAFDSQRAVSWHEVQDCRAAIRALMEGD